MKKYDNMSLLIVKNISNSALSFLYNQKCCLYTNMYINVPLLFPVSLKCTCPIMVNSFVLTQKTNIRWPCWSYYMVLATS